MPCRLSPASDNDFSEPQKADSSWLGLEVPSIVPLATQAIFVGIVHRGERIDFRRCLPG
jgi:hypothetical protein